MTKKYTDKQKHIVIRNYQYMESLIGHNVSYREAKKRIQDHIDGKRFDKTYFVFGDNTLQQKIGCVNYAIGY